MNIFSSLKKRGFLNSVKLFNAYLFDNTGLSREMIARNIDLSSYDKIHNIHTSGFIEMEELEFQNANKEKGNRYGGTPPWLMKEVLDKLSIDFKNYTFIDYGSGMGIALFEASDYEFKEIIGVEYSPQLNEAALKNIETFISSTQKCYNIRSICDDALNFVLPEGPWILYFCCPFNKEMFAKAVSNIHSQSKNSLSSYMIVTQQGWSEGVEEYLISVDFLKLLYRAPNILIFKLDFE